MTSLDRFINVVVHLAKPAPLLTRYRLGIGLLYRKSQQMRKRIKSRHLPTSGFHGDLVRDGQKGQMYRHLYFHLACYLLGPLGWLFSWFIGLTDIKQAASGRKESETEVRDNIAGRECGKILTLFMKGRIDEKTARNQLRRFRSFCAEGLAESIPATTSTRSSIQQQTRCPCGRQTNLHIYILY